MASSSMLQARVVSAEMPKILVVDDEPLIAMMIADWLAEQGLETVGPAHSVSQALALLETQAGGRRNTRRLARQRRLLRHRRGSLRQGHPLCIRHRSRCGYDGQALCRGHDWCRNRSISRSCARWSRSFSRAHRRPETCLTSHRFAQRVRRSKKSGTSPITLRSPRDEATHGAN